MRVRIMVFTLCLCLCTACGRSAETEREMEAETGLSGLWTDFKTNMPKDRNVEDNFRESDFIAGFKAALSDADSMDLSEDELKELSGINGIMILESKTEEGEIRLVYLVADLYNSSVYEVVVKNKYVFMQYRDKDGFAFETLYDGDLYYPLDIKTPEGFAVVISSYGAYYPSPAAIGVWQVGDGEIEDADAFGEYSADGWEFTRDGQTLRIEKEYADGLSYEELQKNVCVLNDDGSVELVSGDEGLALEFDGNKYVLEE